MGENNIEGSSFDPAFPKEPVKRHVRIGTYWKKPPTVTYPSNFGFAVNGYQPMIDYLDAKDLGLTYNKKDIRLPFLEERCLDKYKEDKPFRKYTNHDIDKFIDKGEGIIRQIRQNDAIGLGSALTRTHTNWSMSKKWVQLVKKSHVIDYRKVRADRLAEEQRDAQLYAIANPSRGRSRQTRSRTPSLTRRGTRGKSPSGIPVRTRSGSVAARRDPIRKMVQTYEDAVGTLAHCQGDHDKLITRRKDRLDELDTQFEDVISNLANNLARLNKRTEQFGEPSENIADEQVLEENKLRRRRELDALSDEVNELTRADRPTVRRNMDLEVDDMNSRLNNIAQRQRDERLADLEALTALTQAAAAYAARKAMSRGDLDTGIHESVPVETANPRRKHYGADKMSDVQARVIHKASELSSTSSAASRIARRARYVNVYSPKPETGDSDHFVKPSRTEINIDNMARSFVERGKMTRKYDVDDEVDAPVSSLNTHVMNEYRNYDAKKAIIVVPSNSSRVRYAIIRARARNTLLGN